MQSFHHNMFDAPDVRIHYVTAGTAPGNGGNDKTIVLLSEKGKLTMPVLGLGGTASFYYPIAGAMLSEVAENVTVEPVEDSGHWIAEEQPDSLLEHLRKFVQATGGN